MSRRAASLLTPPAHDRVALKIELDASVTPPSFRFSDAGGDSVRLLEIRITELGDTAPSWWLVHGDAWLEDAVALHILTIEEAEGASVPITRRLDNDLEGLVADSGVPVSHLRYGQVPEGFRQHGALRELKPNRLYELIATGSTVGKLEFYG